MRVRQTSTRPGVRPLRVVLVALLLAGLGLWQAWQCTDDMAPMLGPATAVVAHVPPGEHMGDPDAGHEPGGHGGLAALCMSVLAAVAAAFVLLADPLRLLALLRRVASALVRPVGPLPQAATLAQLCVSRT